MEAKVETVHALGGVKRNTISFALSGKAVILLPFEVCTRYPLCFLHIRELKGAPVVIVTRLLPSV